MNRSGIVYKYIRYQPCFMCTACQLTYPSTDSTNMYSVRGTRMQAQHAMHINARRHAHTLVHASY